MRNPSVTDSCEITINQNLLPYPLRWKDKAYVLVGLTGLLLIVIIFATTLGSIHIPFSTCFQVLFSWVPFINVNSTYPDGFNLESLNTIILDIRLPRILLAGLVGAALSVAGATYQGLFRNPLADPYFLGVASGAGLGATIAFLIPFTFSWMVYGSVPLFAFVGAMGAVAVVYLLARIGKTLPATALILAGVTVGAFLSSITSYLMTIYGKQLHGIIFWLLGGFSLTKWVEVWTVLPGIVGGIIVIWLHARPLNVLQLDEEQAQQLGINVEMVKLILLSAATLITSAAVCFTGLIGYVGIIVPHTVRLIWGPDHRFLLPLSTMIGAIFLIIADTLAHTLLPPREIPVGIITAFCGAPFFLYLLRRKKGLAFF
jgi:iron complex transport system permease protein